MKGLRRLDAEEALPVDGRVEESCALCERVGDGEYGHRAIGLVEGRDQPIDDLGRAEGSGSVVDQDRTFADGFKTVENAVGSLRTALDRVADVHAVQRRARQILLPSSNYHT